MMEWKSSLEFKLKLILIEISPTPFCKLMKLIKGDSYQQDLIARSKLL